MKQVVRGIPRPELLRIWDEVQATQKRLDSCVGPHDFHPLQERPGQPPRHHLCARCQGRLDVIHAHWYAKGLEHARR